MTASFPFDPDLARRRSLLYAALAFTLLRTRDGAAPPETEWLRRWLDSWRGVGDIVTGMARQDYDLALTRFGGRGWRATFFVTGMEHSATNATGTAFESTPWRAVQVAAWEALNRAPGLESGPTPAPDVIVL